jgi:DNA (cytosine-5)-methyltransferase 1
LINYYNENDPKAAAWLRELIKDGHIANGVVDERSIKDVQPHDLTEFTQCHFFAGIGGWSYALRLAGWPDDRAVWTGSCPCQPFSAAGQKGGTEDKRHLWPDFFRLIRERRPPVVFGEQVASKDGLARLDIVSADLESADYAVGAADLCAAGVQAPHIRQRLWFVAHANGADASAERQQHGGKLRLQSANGGALRLAESTIIGWGKECTDDGGQPEGDSAQGWPAGLESSGVLGELAITESEQHDRRRDARTGRGEPTDGSSLVNAESEQARLTGRPWFPRGADSADWIECIDGKWRPVEPGTFPLAYGVPARVGRLRGYGNAIVPQVAAEFVRATMDSGHGC